MAFSPSNGRPRLRRRAAAGTVAAALCAGLLSGCSGSSDASGSGATTTVAPADSPPLPTDMAQGAACALVTPAEVEAAVGAKVGPGKEERQPARTLCSFPLAAAPDQSVFLVSTTSSGVPAFFASVRDRAASPAAVSAGDEAFVSGAQAVVRKGNTMVAIVVVLRQGPPQLAAAATKLAQAVGRRL